MSELIKKRTEAYKDFIEEYLRQFYSQFRQEPQQSLFDAIQHLPERAGALLL